MNEESRPNPLIKVWFIVEVTAGTPASLTIRL